ncbi:MAG: Na+/H+ antiporter subunit D [Bdellovibrionales bacterium CG10_big_fil_rev_8_21_14_0_10_45_34]|nr:MAG: Na+/H+ antiporter subunit D [Bdellovibrionales bacterium CG10_big_fil_rev_8_21_14_0_10_45_34]
MAIVLPLLIPLLSAIFSLLLWHSPKSQRALALIGSLSHLLSGIWLLKLVNETPIITYAMGNWSAPYGIVFIADGISAWLILLSGFMYFVSQLSQVTLKKADKSFAEATFIHFLIFGVSGAFLTGDLFNLYVWFEVLLVSSFVLMTLGGKPAQIRAGLKYMALNLIGSTLFLSALGLIYGWLGTLNMAHIAYRLSHVNDGSVVLAIGLLLTVAFGLKAAIFPLFGWLPESYPSADPEITALFSALLTKVGVYALLRLYAFMLPPNSLAAELLIGLSVITMVVGVLGAASQYSIRKILSFHIVSQIGYITLAIAIGGAQALSAAMFYLIHNVLAKANLFLIGGEIERGPEKTDELKSLGGLYGKSTFLTVTFLISAFSLAGIPPLSGFFAKYSVIASAIKLNYFWSAVVAAIVGILTLFSMIKIWNEAFWKENPAAGVHSPQKEKILWGNKVSITVVCLATLSLTIWYQPMKSSLDKAANKLLDRESYYEAVFSHGLLKANSTEMPTPQPAEDGPSEERGKLQ